MADEPESSEVQFEGPVFSVARERWPGSRHPHDVVRHVGASGVLPVTPGGEVVLVRQFRPAIRRALVEIPAGLLDVRDEEPHVRRARAVRGDRLPAHLDGVPRRRVHERGLLG